MYTWSNNCLKLVLQWVKFEDRKIVRCVSSAIQLCKCDQQTACCDSMMNHTHCETSFKTKNCLKSKYHHSALGINNKYTVEPTCVITSRWPPSAQTQVTLQWPPKIIPGTFFSYILHLFIRTTCPQQPFLIRSLSCFYLYLYRFNCIANLDHVCCKNLCNETIHWNLDTIHRWMVLITGQKHEARIDFVI